MTARAERKADDERPARVADPSDADREATVERLQDRMADVVRHHFGEKPKKLTVRHGGLTNTVYTFKVRQGDFVIRTHDDPGKIADYLKEQWTMDAARAVGVPTPRVLEVGNVATGHPYMITEWVRGVEGCEAPDRLSVLAALGRTTAALHGVRTHGFGPVFDWSGNRLSRFESWRDWLVRGFDVEKRLRTLSQHRLLDERQVALLRETAEQMSRWRKPVVLHHGDLRLKNTIVDADTGRLVALIDWESSMSLPAPYWDLALALHDLGIDEKEAFLDGYGIGARKTQAMLPFLRLFNVLNYAGPVECAVAAADRVGIERFRLRLRGGLELYEG